MRNGPTAPIELYDLAKDVGETTDLADKHPDLVAKAEKIMKEARTDDPNWPLRGAKKRGGKNR